MPRPDLEKQEINQGLSQLITDVNNEIEHTSVKEQLPAAVVTEETVTEFKPEVVNNPIENNIEPVTEPDITSTIRTPVEETATRKSVIDKLKNVWR